MTNLNLENIINDDAAFSKKYILDNIHEKELTSFKEYWRSELYKVDRPNGSQSTGFLKKRLVDILRSHRSALA